MSLNPEDLSCGFHLKNRKPAKKQKLHHGVVCRRHYPRTSCSLLALINPKLSQVIEGSMCYWFATAYLQGNLTL